MLNKILGDVGGQALFSRKDIYIGRGRPSGMGGSESSTADAEARAERFPEALDLQHRNKKHRSVSIATYCRR